MSTAVSRGRHIGKKTPFSLKVSPRPLTPSASAPAVAQWEPCEECESEGGCYAIRVLSWFPCSASPPVCLQSRIFLCCADSKIFLKIVSEPSQPPAPAPPASPPPPLLYSALAAATFSSIWSNESCGNNSNTPALPSVSLGNQRKASNEEPSISRLLTFILIQCMCEFDQTQLLLLLWLEAVEAKHE